MTLIGRIAGWSFLCLSMIGVCSVSAYAQAPSAAEQPAQPTGGQAANVMTCTSQIGERIQCTADTSGGVALVRSRGAAPCLFGDSWGFDANGIWVADGCSGVFLLGRVAQVPTQVTEVKQTAPSHVPNAGFLLFNGEKGQIYFRLFSYARYLNQRNLDPTYVDAFGNTKTVQQRQDIQLQKFFSPFSGWFLDPRFRYYLYVWSSNASQGDPAQVVGAGNLSWTFNRFATVGAGITSLPSTRSTEGQFPYWLGVDNRLIADEFFRGSYTSGAWLKGEIAANVKYFAMVGNNLSTLGVSAAQLDNGLNTVSTSVQWLPTTGEFGLYGTFGDYDYHQKLATRVSAHFTHSIEDKQSQPGTDAIENSQIRLTDGSSIFTPNLFGLSTTVEKVTYKMATLDAGFKKKGISVEGEYYWRWLDNYVGVNVSGVPNIFDTGYQLQTSAMPIPNILQGYFSWSQIFGEYGDPWEVRGGANWYFLKQRGVRLNTELMHVNRSPVGYTNYPYPVGGNGNVIHINLEMNF